VVGILVLLGLGAVGAGAYFAVCHFTASEHKSSPSSSARLEEKKPDEEKKPVETVFPLIVHRRTQVEAAEPAPPAPSIVFRPPQVKATERADKAPPPEVVKATEPAPPPSADAPPPPPPKPPDADKALVLSDFDKKLETYHTLIKPQPGEWKFAEVPWMPTVWDARIKAAKEGKPVFIWYMAGEPLGQC
jgi:hypothetical protein